MPDHDPTTSENDAPFTLNGEAKKLRDRRASDAAYYAANREQLKAQKQAYRAANRVRRNAKDKAWREANREKEAARTKAYYAANRVRINANRKAWREANREKEAARGKAYCDANLEKVFAKYLRRHRGLTLDEVAAMEQQQDGRCAICRTPFTDAKRHIDHDHATGKVRALLCMHCNRGLGGFQDNPKLLRRAIAYLKRHAQIP